MITILLILFLGFVIYLVKAPKRKKVNKKEIVVNISDTDKSDDSDTSWVLPAYYLLYH